MNVASGKREPPQSQAVSVQQPTNHIFHIRSVFCWMNWEINNCCVFVYWSGDTKSERFNFTTQPSDNMENLSESIMYRSANACTVWWWKSFCTFTLFAISRLKYKIHHSSSLHKNENTSTNESSIQSANLITQQIYICKYLINMRTLETLCILWLTDTMVTVAWTVGVQFDTCFANKRRCLLWDWNKHNQ